MMEALSLRAIAAELSVTLWSDDRAIGGVTTDSRHVRDGDVYVALRGERFDGHDFVAEVPAKGAIAAIVQNVTSTSIPQLQVGDTRAALGLIARMNRRKFTGPVIGVTGSAGKTTCKEMLAAIFAQAGDTLATQGNLNNEIGVPLTLLRLAPNHRYAVIEMGAARRGDIEYLCRFAEPDIAIVTSALPAHLEGFGSVDTIAATKGEIFAGLREHGTAIINVDSEYEALWRGLAGSHRVFTFGVDHNAMVSASDIMRDAAGVRFTLHTPNGDIAIAMPLLGAHNVRNALAAAAASIAAGLTLDQIRAGLAAVHAMPGRLYPCLGTHGESVIDDSYNANPGAVKAAIDVLAEYSGVRRLILGNMAELGPTSEQLHREVAGYAAERGIDELWCVGPHAPHQIETFAAKSGSSTSTSMPARAQAFANNAALIAAYRQAQIPAVVLVKGSRSAAMENIVAALRGVATANTGEH